MYKENEIELNPGERLDDLQIRGYEIIQRPGRFCFGMDAVLLAAYAKGDPGRERGYGKAKCKV